MSYRYDSIPFDPAPLRPSGPPPLTGEACVAPNVTVLFQMGYKLDIKRIFAKMTVAQDALGEFPSAVRQIEHGKRQDTVCREIFR